MNLSENYLRRCKKIVSFIVSLIALSSYSVTNVGAATTKSFTVDNDTSNTNYSNDSKTYTHYSGTWGTYLNSGYNGDSRLRTSSNKENYEWVWHGNIYNSKYIFCELQVFLADDRFTDPGATYSIYQDSNRFISMAEFKLNQKYAPSGFSSQTIGCTPAVTGGTMHPYYLTLSNSGKANVGTGADAIRVYFTFK